MNPQEAQLVLAYDVGGSHVTAGLCRLSDLEIVREAAAPLSDVDTFEQFVELLGRLASQVSSGDERPSGASLAVPFPFDCEAGVSLMQHKLKALYGRNLRGALAERFGWPPDRLKFLKDATAYLMGELGAGSAKGAARAVGLTLGTGVGCAFAVNGRNVTSGEGVPPGGEIWDLPYAGATVEDLISTRAIRGAYRSRTGSDREVSDLAAAATSDAVARAVFEEFGTHLGQVLRDVIAPFRPDRVVLGGGIARAAQLFLPAVEREIAGLDFRVVISTLFDRAPLAGAAHYWREENAWRSVS